MLLIFELLVVEKEKYGMIYLTGISFKCLCLSIIGVREKETPKKETPNSIKVQYIHYKSTFNFDIDKLSECSVCKNVKSTGMSECGVCKKFTRYRYIRMCCM